MRSIIRFNKQMMPRLQSSSMKTSMLSLSSISTRQALPAISSYRKFCTSGKDANEDPKNAKAKLDEGVNKSKHHKWSPEVATESEMAVKGVRGETDDVSDSTRQDSKDMKEGKIGRNTDKKARQASGATQDTRRSYCTTIELEPEQVRRQKARGGSDPTVDQLHDDKLTRKLHDERMTESRRDFATMTDSEYEKQQRKKAAKATEPEMISETEKKNSSSPLSGSQRSDASRRNSSEFNQQQKRKFTSSAKSDNINKPDTNPFRPAPAAGDTDSTPKKSPTEIKSEKASNQRRSYSSDATTKAGMSFTNAEDEPKRKPTPKFGKLPEQSANQLSGTYSEADATVHASKKTEGQAAFKDRTKADTRTNTATRSYPTGKV